MSQTQVLYRSFPPKKLSSPGVVELAKLFYSHICKQIILIKILCSFSLHTSPKPKQSKELNINKTTRPVRFTFSAVTVLGKTILCAAKRRLGSVPVPDSPEHK